MKKDGVFVKSGRDQTEDSIISDVTKPDLAAKHSSIAFSEHRK